MIFYTVGWILFAIGIVFCLFPSKKINRIYGYRSFRAERSIEAWQYAQKISRKMCLLMGAIGISIGFLLKKTGWTQYFLLEMLLIVFLIIPIFVVTEDQLEKQEGHEEKK